MKKQLLGIAEILEKTNETIRKSIETENPVMIEVFLECQQSAIQIGNQIEELEGEGSKTVKLLEEYCELIYLLSEVITYKQKANQLIDEIRDMLLLICNSIKCDLPESKKEIVFLPYKLSMWDSLESIWISAKEDDSCDCYVIPIPYYDKKSDGSFGKMHYEGDEYPDYVSITAWQDYNIQERHPDVVYIHNPYDKCNYVTSIHPDYYAKELKKYVDTLVYIPYFVCHEDVEKHFCVLPGTMYADKVIVQSEKVRETYIKEFRKFERENHCMGIFGVAEEKFIALGSPKFDKVLNTKRDDITIPDAWNRLITKPDGSRKKVVLYNTSIEALLKHQDKMLFKIEEVLEIFKENEEIVLLWRPHPLSEATLSAMRSNLFEWYKNIIDRYSNEGWGIYDDTSDFHRAIAISDAYYGNWGSVVALYEKTGKPIMIQHEEIKRDGKNT